MVCLCRSNHSFLLRRENVNDILRYKLLQVLLIDSNKATLDRQVFIRCIEDYERYLLILDPLLKRFRS
jgi:hypothetical protein